MTHPAPPPPDLTTTFEPPERVVLGLLAASVAVLAGIALTVVIWRAGYIAAITSLALAFGAAFLYQAAAGRSARKGLIPLVLLILVGVVASFFGVVVSDLWDAYDELGLTDPSRTTFVTDLMFKPDLLSEYGKDAGLFALFAALGVAGVIRQLFAGRG